MALGFLGGIAKTAAGVAGSLTGVSAVAATLQTTISSLSGGGGVASSPGAFCPGTPTNILPGLTARLQSIPGEADRFRAEIERIKVADIGDLREIWSTPAGLATAAVWKGWGGRNCDVSSTERQLQAAVNRIMALPLPAGVTVAPAPILGGGTGGVDTFSTPTLSTVSGQSSGLSVPVMLGIAGVAVVAFALLRRRQK